MRCARWTLGWCTEEADRLERWRGSGVSVVQKLLPSHRSSNDHVHASRGARVQGVSSLKKRLCSYWSSTTLTLVHAPARRPNGRGADFNGCNGFERVCTCQQLQDPGSRRCATGKSIAGLAARDLGWREGASGRAVSRHVRSTPLEIRSLGRSDAAQMRAKRRPCRQNSLTGLLPEFNEPDPRSRP